MNIISKTYNSFQDKYQYEYIIDSDNEVSNLPTSSTIACGSSAIAPSGTYFLFSTGWSKFGAEEE